MVIGAFRDVVDFAQYMAAEILRNIKEFFILMTKPVGGIVVVSGLVAYDSIFNQNRYVLPLAVIFMILILSKEFRKGDFRAWKRQKDYDRLGIQRVKPGGGAIA